MRHARIALATMGLFGLIVLSGCAGDVTVADGTTPPATRTPHGSDDVEAGEPAEGDSDGGRRPPATPEPSTAGPDEERPTPSASADPSRPDRAPESSAAPDRPSASPPAPTQGGTATSSPDSGPEAQPSPTNPSEPSPNPSPTAPIENWAALISQSRTGKAPEAFRERERYVSCGDLVRDHGQELVPPEVVDCLDAGAAGDGAEAAIAVPSETGAALVWFVRVGPTGAEVYIDATRDSSRGSWQYASCEAGVSIGRLACDKPGPVPTPTGDDARPEAGEEGTMAA